MLLFVVFNDLQTKIKVNNFVYFKSKYWIIIHPVFESQSLQRMVITPNLKQYINVGAQVLLQCLLQQNWCKVLHMTA